MKNKKISIKIEEIVAKAENTSKIEWLSWLNSNNILFTQRKNEDCMEHFEETNTSMFEIQEEIQNPEKYNLTPNCVSCMIFYFTKEKFSGYESFVEESY